MFYATPQEDSLRGGKAYTVNRKNNNKINQKKNIPSMKVLLCISLIALLFS